MARVWSFVLLSVALILSANALNVHQMKRHERERSTLDVTNRALTEEEQAKVADLTSDFVSEISSSLLGSQSQQTTTHTESSSSSSSTSSRSESSGASSVSKSSGESSESSEESAYSYAEQREWGGLCSSGTRQSPIDIVMSKAKIVTAATSDTFPTFVLGNSTELKMEYNNKTFFVKDPKGQLGEVVFRGGVYTFQQLHFHHVSEHSFDGKRYPAELHLVYQRKGKSVTGASNTLTLAFFYDTSAGEKILAGNSDWAGDVFLTDMAVTPDVAPTFGKSLKLNLVDLSVFNVITKGHFYTYEGSQASPPCTESTTYIVYPIAVPVLEQQLAFLTQRFDRPPFPGTGNARDTRPSNAAHQLTLIVYDNPASNPMQQPTTPTTTTTSCVGQTSCGEVVVVTTTTKNDDCSVTQTCVKVVSSSSNPCGSDTGCSVQPEIKVTTTNSCSGSSCNSDRIIAEPDVVDKLPQPAAPAVIVVQSAQPDVVRAQTVSRGSVASNTVCTTTFC